ncbi:hypothetical protein L228DRAFT_257543 [Xylona heveae TC161]|uniref:Low temperature requirement A n=1 Tax=Xylona heveae (strain CBS 132557 / TC161) TaxID=1328760 RepID=A0A165JCC1_XYLHT|nr:hypothetical protein L228DRAFT_257543 [Xylona heveae TC161]KZF26046.1 hypothetical protein L228DRAFT_257543 [Xylona heveae TC161]
MGFRFLERDSSEERAGSERAIIHRRRKEWVPFYVDPLQFTSGDDYAFRRHEDATNIELFFDLFFVANLTTFSSVHEINDRESLFSFMGFIAIIWATWLQIALYDVRFAFDCYLERAYKLVQMAIMLGFAAVGSNFSTSITNENYKAFAVITVLLAVSRVLFILQYSVLMYFVKRRHLASIKPLIFTVCVFALTAVLYLALLAPFLEHDSAQKIYNLWYIAIVPEALAVFLVSIKYPLLSFEGTHLVKRMALLTLILLGEGVITVTKTMTKMAGQNAWNWNVFWEVLVFAGTIYLLWQLYFDRHAIVTSGILGEQVWALLHFPFHIALALVFEGIQNFSIVINISYQIEKLSNVLVSSCFERGENGVQLANALNKTITSFHFATKDNPHPEGLEAINDILIEIQNTTSGCSADTPQAAQHLTPLLQKFADVTVVALFKRDGIEPPGKGGTHIDDVDAVFHVFFLSYAYFFIAAAIVLFAFMAFLFIVRRPNRDILDYIAIVVRGVMGFLMLGLAALGFNDQAMENFVGSLMILPTFMLVLFAIVLADWILDWVSIRRKGRNYSIPAAELNLTRVNAHCPRHANTTIRTPTMTIARDDDDGAFNVGRGRGRDGDGDGSVPETPFSPETKSGWFSEPVTRPVAVRQDASGGGSGSGSASSREMDDNDAIEHVEKVVGQDHLSQDHDDTRRGSIPGHGPGPGLHPGSVSGTAIATATGTATATGSGPAVSFADSTSEHDDRRHRPSVMSLSLRELDRDEFLIGGQLGRRRIVPLATNATDSWRRRASQPQPLRTTSGLGTGLGIDEQRSAGAGGGANNRDGGGKRRSSMR